MKKNFRSLSKIAFSALIVLLLGGAISGNSSGVSHASAPITGGALWQDISQSSIVSTGNRDIVPAIYRLVSVNPSALTSLLASAPTEGPGTTAANSSAVISLPMPDGSMGRFSFVNSSIMAPELAAQFPELQTYLGQGIDDKTATVRFDRTQFGFHAMILSATGTYFIDPYQRNDTVTYISYDKANYVPSDKNKWIENEVTSTVGTSQPATINPQSTGTELRTYRLALAADGEYTAFYGGTVAGALAGMVTTINRVNGVYEREIAVRLVLVANDSQLIYTNPATDPYTNDNAETLLTENQANVDSVIGNANYDIGHVFTTGGGGLAGLGVVCTTGQKASAETGSSSPSGDSYDIDYVAHEMGHEYGGEHTFNDNSQGSCAGNRSNTTAWEPGSGTTIMAYAGICGSENTQAHSDEYFNIGSIDQIDTYIASGGGGCGVVTPTGNHPPVVNAGANFTIPMHTPFKLTGSATDQDGDTLTYNWEEGDVGTAAPPDTDDGSRAIFRSFAVKPVNYRYFPQLSDILSGAANPTFGEAWPTTNRTMLMRLSVRDNHAGGGGLASADTHVTSTTSSGPFVVTAPNTAVTWTGMTTEAVTWDVANTTSAPVSCANVDITLSTDGGATFATSLAAGTANDGTQSITVPNVSTGNARVMVACSNNIFLDISNTNFTIIPNGANTPTATTTPPTATPTGATTATETATPSGSVTPIGSVTPTACSVSFTDVPANSTFYPYIHCLACQGIVGGYPDGTFHPENNVTRGQLSKIVSNSAGFDDEIPSTQQTFEDVAPASTFWLFVERMFAHGAVGGYPCGGNGEPCGSGNLPYFRPGNNASRGQISKIVVLAAGLPINTAGGPHFSDVATTSTFYDQIETLFNAGAINGYSDGTFRPANNASRGQTTKIDSLVFFPDCNATPR